jgi:hypothetical protein
MGNNEDFRKGTDILGGLETSFECAGMCEESKYFAFSDVRM